nr:MAG TPA: polyVal ADP-ribosyltransferase [Caudoviricetes sp.]
MGRLVKLEKEPERRLGDLNAGTGKRGRLVRIDTEPQRRIGELGKSAAAPAAAEKPAAKPSLAGTSRAVADTGTGDAAAERGARRQRYERQLRDIQQRQHARQLGAKNTAGTEEIEEARQQAELRKRLATLDLIDKYGQRNHEDTYGGYIKSQYDIGQLGQDQAHAWSAVMRNPTAANLEYAQHVDSMIEDYTQRNQQALDSTGNHLFYSEDAPEWLQKAGKWADETIGANVQYLPQAKEQFFASIVPAVLGLMAGDATGGKLGYSLGTALYSASTMAGSAYQALRELGADHETAKKMATNEAFLSSLIEWADTFADLSLFGFGKAAGKLGANVGKAGLVQAAKQFGASGAGKALGFLGNIAQEGLEEGTQQAVSIANRERYLRGYDPAEENFFQQVGGLTGDAAKIFWNGLKRDDPNHQEIMESAKGGAQVAIGMGALGFGTGAVTNRVMGDITGLNDPRNAFLYEGQSQGMTDPRAQLVQETEPAARPVTELVTENVTEPVTENAPPALQAAPEQSVQPVQQAQDGEAILNALAGDMAREEARQNRALREQEAARREQEYLQAVQTQNRILEETEAQADAERYAMSAEVARKSGGGLLQDEYTDTLDRRDMTVLDAAARQLGVTVSFAGEINHGLAEGQIVGRAITLQRDAESPLRQLFGHEIAHRLRALAPKEFDRFVQAVKAADPDFSGKVAEMLALGRRADEQYSEPIAIEDVAADYAGMLMDKPQTLETFIAKNQHNPTLLQRLGQIFRELAQKLKGKLTGQQRTQAENAAAALEKAYAAAVKAERKNGAEREGVRYSLKKVPQVKPTNVYDYSKSFAEQIADYEAGKIPKNDTLLVGKTPEVFQKIGMTDLPVTINQQHIEYALHGTKDFDHALGAEGLRQLPKALESPVAILSSKTKNGSSLVAMLEIRQNGKQVVVPVAIDGYGTLNWMQIDSNAITSVYGKNFSISKVLKNALEAEANGKAFSVYYVNKEKAARLFEVARVPMPKMPQSSPDGFVHSIREAGSPVNPKLENVTQSQQFKRWFGDWQNHPENASKVVNEDGTPKVVYHGTGSNFNAFDPLRQGENYPQGEGGFFFTTSRKSAENYAALHDKDGKGRVVEAYLSIRNPYEVTAYGDYVQAPAEKYDDHRSEYLNEAERQGCDGIIVKGEKSTLYVVFDPTQIKSATDNIGTFDRENPDIRYSLKRDAALEKDFASIREQLEAGELTEEQADRLREEAVDRLLARQAEEYGRMQPGEKPAREITLPRRTDGKTKVSRTVRTILEGKATPELALPGIKQLVAEGAFSYEALGDNTVVENANAQLESEGWSNTYARWSKDMDKGVYNKANTAMGFVLYNNAVNSGETQAAMDILRNLVMSQRTAAQATQATRILKTLSPEAQLYAAQRSIDSLQREITQRYGDKAPQLKISEALAEDYMQAATQQAREAALDKIYQDIGSQLPSSLADRWNAWRYLSMLGNPRTHVRNILGNAFFAPVVFAKNRVGAAMEAAAYQISGGKTGRSKAIVGLSKGDRALYRAAFADFGNMENVIMDGQKLSDAARMNKSIQKGQVVFKHLKALEAFRKANGRLLDAEDAWFCKRYYANALASYAKKNGISAEMIVQNGDGLAAARAYAIREAQRGTYRDVNAFSQMVTGIGNAGRNSKNAFARAGNLLMQGVLPFKKTPANILARGVEYSPLGFLTSIAAYAKEVRRSGITVDERQAAGIKLMDGLSAGLTGTGLMALGFLMAGQGWLRGHGSDDDKERRQEEANGHQAYSLEAGGVSVTLDWVAPEALPVFAGANLYEIASSMKNGDWENGPQMKDYIKAITQLSDPMVEMSMLSGVADVIQSTAYAKNQDESVLAAILKSAATSYVTQALPTLFGQIERVSEDRRYTPFIDKTDFLSTDLQRTVSKASSKIPGWDYNQVPYIDAWGREEESGTLLKRAGHNFLNPAYTSKIKEGPLEKELMRVYKKTGDGGCFPSRAEASFKVNGENRYLNQREYLDYARKKGKWSREYVQALIDSRAYKRLSDEEKAEALADAYALANAQAKKAVAPDYQPGSWTKNALKAREDGISTTLYLEARAAVKPVLEGLRDEDGETIANSESLLKLEQLYTSGTLDGLSGELREALLGYLGIGKKVRGYTSEQVRGALLKMRG